MGNLGLAMVNRGLIRSIESLGYVIGGDRTPRQVLLWARKIKGGGYHEVRVHGTGEDAKDRGWVELAIAVGIDVEDG